MIRYERHDLSGVPDYSAAEFSARQSDYCLLIPVINEGARILTELGRAQRAGVDKMCDIVLCDGGSTDGSMKEETLQLYGVNTLLIKTGPGKQGAQLRMGIYFALNRGYKGVLTIDGNNKDSIEDVPRFIAKLVRRRAAGTCPADQPGGTSVVYRYHQRLPCLQPGISDPSRGTAIARRL